MFTHACLLFVSWVLAAPSAADDAATDAKALAGTWKLVKGEEKGREFPEEVRQGFELKVEGDKFTFSVLGQQMLATYKLNPAANPKELDVTWTEGPDQGKTVKCVYELKDGTFSFRAGRKDGSGERPKSLTEGGEIFFAFKKSP